MALCRQGHVVVVANGGQEALDLAQAQPPDLILLDYIMPDMGAGAVIEQLRAHPDLAKTQIVLATGEMDPEPDLDVALVLCKPFKLDELYQAVDAALGTARG